ncbi:MAG: hypothetical protein L0G25_04085 [Psychrobacter sp.]|nr:hypothetical protein [Psychrobacter sp.]
MTNTQSHSSQTANKAIKKTDPFAALKSSIMMVSIVGTMAGWLVLLNQETDSQPIDIDTALLSASVSENNEKAAEPMPTLDISQLCQVNEIQPVEAITVVARTRSSQ